VISAGTRELQILTEVREMTWADQALCAEVGGDEWFPEKGDSTRNAKAVCRRCEVRQACLQYALEHDERFGIWGATSERERRTMRRSLNQQGRAAA
jgi:WhiB family transcriptional regulator, redox-sensing transcriptional regulator